MKKDKERERRPHCKICGHFHFGLCTECEECTRGNLSEEPVITSEAIQKTVEKLSDPAPGEPYLTDPLTPDFERLTAEEITDRLKAIDVRLTELEEKFDKIDKRREYQKLLMRRRRAKKSA